MFLHNRIVIGNESLTRCNRNKSCLTLCLLDAHPGEELPNILAVEGRIKGA